MLRKRTIQEATDLVVDTDDKAINANAPIPIPEGGDAAGFSAIAEVASVPIASKKTHPLLRYQPTPIMTALEKRKVFFACILIMLAIPALGLAFVTQGSLAHSIFLCATTIGAIAAIMFAIDWHNPSWYRKIPHTRLSHGQANLLSKIAVIACFSLSSLTGLFTFVHKQSCPGPAQVTGPVLAILAHFDMDKAMTESLKQYQSAAIYEAELIRQHRENLLLLADKLPNPSEQSRIWATIPQELVPVFQSASKTPAEARWKKIISWQLNNQTNYPTSVTTMWTELASELYNQGRTHESMMIFYPAFAEKNGAGVATVPEVAFEQSLSLLEPDDAQRIRSIDHRAQLGPNLVISIVPQHDEVSPEGASEDMERVGSRELMTLLIANPKLAKELPWAERFVGFHQTEWQSFERVRNAFGGVNSIAGYDPNGIYTPILRGAIYMEGEPRGVDVINPCAFIPRDTVLIKRDDWRRLLKTQR